MPQEIKSAISGVIRKTGPAGGIRWVSGPNMHLTLKFLGEVKDDIVPVIGQRLQAMAVRHRPFSIDIRGAGAFPNIKRPNVLWIGIDKTGPLRDLFLDIDAGLAELGIEKESRPFSPHLTIGRVRDSGAIGPAMDELSTYKGAFFGSIDVDEILLMKSVLGPSGAEYSKVAVITLDKG